jgi:hypothetical protein
MLHVTQFDFLSDVLDSCSPFCEYVGVLFDENLSGVRDQGFARNRGLEAREVLCLMFARDFPNTRTANIALSVLYLKPILGCSGLKKAFGSLLKHKTRTLFLDAR